MGPHASHVVAAGARARLLPLPHGKGSSELSPVAHLALAQWKGLVEAQASTHRTGRSAGPPLTGALPSPGGSSLRPMKPLSLQIQHQAARTAAWPPRAPLLARGIRLHWWQTDCTFRPCLLSVDVVELREDEPMVAHGLLLMLWDGEAGSAPAVPERIDAASGPGSHFAVHGPAPELGAADAALEGVPVVHRPSAAVTHARRRKCRNIPLPRSQGE
eukprot:CAMPEP_0179106458 /NCGR_PEP_ID=MMETSP0796-20121207/49501_1 /TAXON_ID=73915 /ORGANISM="Pyrodinium bahamense, Strain pbaha01" /LENGTH=215 /DNA_ID=CAMNT_0020804491 /DNA_START=42 /DNA_END=687 /DNA_ORIENTATION=+